MDAYNLKTQQQSLNVSIFEEIRNDIVIGRYKPGDKLNELKLAKEFNVSRTPIREALKQLISDGVVENIPNRGIVVIGVSAQDFKDILTVRSAIDQVAIKWSIERISGKELALLNETYELMEFYTLKGDVDKVFVLITQFHEIIYKSTKSTYLEKVLINFQFITKTMRFRSLSKENRLNASLFEHKMILDAFLSRNTEAALEAISGHGVELSQIIENNLE